jgi:hypothetical protein
VCFTFANTSRHAARSRTPGDSASASRPCSFVRRQHRLEGQQQLGHTIILNVERLQRVVLLPHPLLYLLAPGPLLQEELEFGALLLDHPQAAALHLVLLPLSLHQYRQTTVAQHPVQLADQGDHLGTVDRKVRGLVVLADAPAYHGILADPPAEQLA